MGSSGGNFRSRTAGGTGLDAGWPESRPVAGASGPVEGFLGAGVRGVREVPGARGR